MTWLRGWLLGCLLLWAQIAGAAHALSHLHDAADQPPACEWCLAYQHV